MSRKRIYRVPKMNGGGFFESLFGGAETPNSTATNSANMSTTSGSIETPTIQDNVNMTGSVDTPSPSIESMSGSVKTSIATPDDMNMSGSVDTPSPSIESMPRSVETSIATPDNMNMSGSVETPIESMPGSVDTPSPPVTISPIDNSFPKDDTSAKDAPAPSLFDNVYKSVTDSFNNEMESVAPSPSSIEESPSMDASSDNESMKEDDFVMNEPKSTEPVVGDLIKLLSDKDEQIRNLLGQLESANKNFADTNNKLVECLTSKIPSENTLAQSSPMMSEMSSIGPEMSSLGPQLDSPGFPMSEANTSGSDRDTPFGQSPTESRMGGKTRNRVKKQRRTRRKQMRE